MTTVACVFVRGEYPYTVEYVTKLYAMVRRWLDRPFRFVCLTDRPDLMPEHIEPIFVEVPAGCSAPWAKLELFNPARNWIGRVLYLDLDTLIVSQLAELIDTPEPFVITGDPFGRTGKDAFGRQIVRKFNSSVMAWDGGTQTDLYTDWTPKVADRLSGDQDYLAEKRPDAATWPRFWFPRLSELYGEAPTMPARVVLSKVPKNHLAVKQYPWFDALWGAAA